MIENSKVRSSHTHRAAIIYIRQSHPSQVENNRESTARQYALVEKAMALGWDRSQVTTIDEDLGLSGKVFVKRSGFDHLNAEVALGRVGILLGLEVSRLARSNADWYRLLDMCAITDTLLADSDGVYHPALFNDRLILGLKGTMSEAELHVLRQRLDGGLRNKAARGELRRALPVGLIWGEKEGEVRFHPDEAVTGCMRTIFAKFTELGSARQVWLWFRSEKLSFPQHPSGIVPTLANCHQLRWVSPTYIAINNVLRNPVYAGVYVYGKTRNECYVDEDGTVRKRIRTLPREEWSVFLPGHHEGFIDWATFEANQMRLQSNIRAELHQAGRALREGSALSGRRWRIRLPSRWPPSAAQTWCAVFPRHAFTKTQTTRYDAGPTEWGRLRTYQVDPVHQSPRTMMYGFFPKELIHLIALTRLTSLLFLPAFVCRLPRPTPVADRSVTRLSPCLKYYSAVRLLTAHRSPLRFRL